MSRKRGKHRPGAKPPSTARAPDEASRPVVWPSSVVVNFGLLAVVCAALFRQVFLHPDQLLWGSDVERVFYPFRFIQHDAFHRLGRFPLWDPTMLCGRSVVGDSTQLMLSPLAWIFWVSSSPLMFGLYFWAYVTVGAWGVFVWMRSKELTAVGAFVAALGFAFSGKTAAHVFAGHMDVLPTMMCAPWVFWASERLLRRPSFGAAVALGGVLSLAVTAGHLPTVYWAVLLAMAYITAQGVLLGRELGWRTLRRPAALLLAAGCIFALGAMAWWLPVLRQTLLLSARANQAGGGAGFAAMGSAAPADLLRLIWPFNGLTLPIPFASDPENNFFWETASYPGLVTLALACTAILVAPRQRDTRLLGGFALATILLALGPHTPLYGWVYAIVPGVSLMRDPGRLLIFSNLFLGGLAGLGVDRLIGGSTHARWRFFSVTLGLLLVALISDPMVDASSVSLAGGHLLPIFVFSSLALAGFFYARQRLTSKAMALVIVAIAMADFGIVWSAHIFTAPPDQVCPTNSVASFLKEHSAEPSRYFDPTDTVPQQLAAREGLQTITGYHPGIYAHQLAMYHALWPPGEGSDLAQLLMHSPRSIACTSLLDLMNLRYVVAYEPELDARFRKVFTTPPGEFKRPRSVFERTTPLPHVFIVPSGRSVTIEEALPALCSLDPRKECTVQGTAVSGTEVFRSISCERPAPGTFDMDFVTAGSGVVVASEAWHPDWIATDNGAAIGVERVDYGFVGIPVGAGAHHLQLRYRPWDFYLGCIVSGSFWVALAASMFWIHLARMRRRRSTAEAPKDLARDPAASA